MEDKITSKLTESNPIKEISELQKIFEEINAFKSKSVDDKYTVNIMWGNFLSELKKSDDDKYLEFHFSLLELRKRFLQDELKMVFGFRQSREKVHNFLKNKLKTLQDEKLKNDINEILEELNFCDLEGLKQWLKDLKSGKRKDENEFVWSIMLSPYTEYHYSLMTDKNTKEEFRHHLWSRFDEHKEKGAALLLSKLDNNEDTDFHPDIIFTLGILADRPKIEKERTLAYARKFANANSDFLRDRAIIVLGWIGGLEDIPLLGEHLLNDTNAKCRTWAALSLNFPNKSKSLVDKALPLLKQAISQEKDYYALGCMIDVVKELTGKKFDLPQNAIDNIDAERIDAAKLKVERFFKKLYKK